MRQRQKVAGLAILSEKVAGVEEQYELTFLDANGCLRCNLLSCLQLTVSVDEKREANVSIWT